MTLYSRSNESDFVIVYLVRHIPALLLLDRVGIPALNNFNFGRTLLKYAYFGRNALKGFKLLTTFFNLKIKLGHTELYPCLASISKFK